MSEANNSFEKNIEFVANSESNMTLDSQASSSESQAREKEINWHKLAHKLREHNRKLLKKVFQLEQEIIESNKALEEHIKRSRSNDIYVAKQAETINKYQEELAELSQQITIYQQEKSSQEFVMDNLQQRLTISEQNADELKQQYSELEAAKKLQNQQLLAKNQQLQELNTRFNRQQQYLLEYKAHQNGRLASKPIKAWSADNTEKASVKTAVSPTINSTDWPAPAIANSQTQINSIAAIQLPMFPRQAEGE